jgi:hypothetical protein
MSQHVNILCQDTRFKIVKGARTAMARFQLHLNPLVMGQAICDLHLAAITDLPSALFHPPTNCLKARFRSIVTAPMGLDHTWYDCLILTLEV